MVVLPSSVVLLFFFSLINKSVQTIVQKTASNNYHLERIDTNGLGLVQGE